MPDIGGLSSSEAAARLASVGPNALPERAPEPWWHRLLRQFQSPLIYLLVVALAFDLGLWLYEGAHAWPIDAVAIAAILLLNAALGLYQEQRSEAALARLRQMAAGHAWALRDGHFVRVPFADLVPDDVVRLEAGDRVPADGLLRDAHGAMLDESLLSGESVPVDKGNDEEAFSGTLLVRGRASLTITRTGASSAMGRLVTTLGDIEMTETPLERRVDQLGRQIARAVLLLAATLAVGGIAVEGLAGAPAMLLLAVALAVAAVPEGLPAVLTVALALGVERMARAKAVVRRLAAVEALGSVTVIATDKTGTLTENRMEVRALDTGDRQETRPEALRAAVFANDADLQTAAGDPLDAGLLAFAASEGMDIAALRQRHPRESEKSFDSAWKFMRATVRDGERTISYLKGAPEVLLARAVMDESERAAWASRAQRHAADGLRVIALASAEGEREEELRFLGLALLWDPPRAEVTAAMDRAMSAGIRVVMITGDHGTTARAIAERVGLTDVQLATGEELDRAEGQALDDLVARTNVFARVRPEQKLRIIEALQRQGETVAMTGDGVNDAAALKRSHVGIAMGQRGSDVSREVADLVLLDDNFATIVAAVQEGRGIYENIQTFLRFLFSTNLSEVLLVAGGIVLAWLLGLRDSGGMLMLPLLASQILWINLVTDGVPALALAFDRRPDVMTQRPRPSSAPLLDRRSTQFVVGAGLMKGALAIGILELVNAVGHDYVVARATTFHFMAIGQLLLTYPARLSATRPEPNRSLHGAVIVGVLLQVVVAVVPFLSAVLGGVALPPAMWLVVGGGAVVAWALAAGLARWLWSRPDRPGAA